MRETISDGCSQQKTQDKHERVHARACNLQVVAVALADRQIRQLEPERPQTVGSLSAMTLPLQTGNDVYKRKCFS